MLKIQARPLILAMAAFALLYGIEGQAWSQQPLPTTPVPVSPPPGNTSPIPSANPPALGRPVPIASQGQPTPLGYVPPPPPAPVGVAPPPGAVVAPLDPGSDGWGPLGAQSSPPGWFFDVEVAYVFPNLNFKLTNDVPLPKTNETLNTPSVGLDSTVMPAFEIGYRLPESTGLFALSYSFLFAEGTGERPMLNVPSQVKTRGQVNWLDLDYGTVPYEFSPRYTINYRIGARIGDIYMDSTASNALRTESISSDFFGAGPHARMDIERRIVPLPGLALYGRLDGVVYVGQVKQKAQLSLANPGGQVINDSFYVRRTQTSPYGNLQAGLSYSPPAIPALKLTLGYLIESYWNVGRLGTDGATGISASRGQLWSQGAFLRGQWDF